VSTRRYSTQVYVIRLIYALMINICLGGFMPKRTTVILDDDIYENLVRESIRRYGTTRAISKVLNEILRDSLSGRRELIRLIYSEKIAEVSIEEFNEFRRELSKRLVER